MSGGLISAPALAARLDEANIVILDTRSGTGSGAAFEAGHIPGARHTDYGADGWRARVGNAPGMLPDAAHLSALFARLGLQPGQPIIVVPAGQSATDLAAAARIFWTLKVCGLMPEAILDGGMSGWISGNFPLETGASQHRPSAPALVAMGKGRATAADTLAAINGQSAALVDGRAASFFNGIDKAPEARVAGRLPGAVSVDYVRAYDGAANRLRSIAELNALYAALPPGTPVISYCNTGHTAALNWFVLAEVLGRRDVSLYDGSMTEWTQDPARPVAG